MADEAARLAEAVDLQPLGKLAPSTLEALAARLSRRVRLPVHTRSPATVPLLTISGRQQLDAGALLEALESRVAGGRLLVGVTEDDIAVPVFSFVFGLARQGGAACVVSLARTDPTFYGLPADSVLTHERAIAEVLHELGHLAGLEHCADKGCLMSFAGNVERVDTRGGRFCDGCAARLPRWLRSPPPAEAA